MGRGTKNLPAEREGRRKVTHISGRGYEDSLRKILYISKKLVYQLGSLKHFSSNNATAFPEKKWYFSFMCYCDDIRALMHLGL